MSTDYTRAPWLVDPAAPQPSPVPRVGSIPSPPPDGVRPLLPRPPEQARPRAAEPPHSPTPAQYPAPPQRPGLTPGQSQPTSDLSGSEELGEQEYQIVEDLRDRVSTRLTVEDKNYAPSARRELTKKLIRDEYGQWQLFEANKGHPALRPAIEEKIFAAVLAELDGLGRMAPLLARHDVEDVHFEGCDPTMLRLHDGSFVQGPPLAGTDEELEQLLRSIGARSEDGQSSREFSSSHPILNIRLKGVTELGARLQAAMDVLPRPAGVIRIHRFSDPSLRSLQDMPTNMIDNPMHAFLHYAVAAGASSLISGNPGVGKTTMLRAMIATIPWGNVVITVEDERELGSHLPHRDPKTGQMVKRHAVSRSFESRLPNSEGMGGFDMTEALHEALRMSTTWTVVGEVRSGYVMALLDAATSGVASVLCTIHGKTAHSVFKKVLINALKANPAPSPELVMASLSELDLVIHVTRDRYYNRFVSGIYELGSGIGDAGQPALTPIFAPSTRHAGRPIATGAGSLSVDLKERMDAVGFDAERWLDPTREPPTWRVNGQPVRPNP